MTLMVQRCVDLVRGKGRVWHNSHVSQQSSNGETGSILKKDEKLIGLTEVQQSQAKVLQCERMLLESLQERREIAGMIMDVQRRIKDIHMELEKTVRGENKYLVLVTQEHQVIKNEETLMRELRKVENRERERETMTDLSNSVRESQEKER